MKQIRLPVVLLALLTAAGLAALIGSAALLSPGLDVWEIIVTLALLLGGFTYVYPLIP